jgi:patatin-like phospholipase/acyl hydrolase
LARFQILSLIGGGIRGAFIIAYLRELERRIGRPITESFDLIAGTSTGGIIAAGLALGLSTEELYDFYRNHGEKIFSPRERYRARGLMQFVFPLADRVFKWKTGGSLDVAFRARFWAWFRNPGFRVTQA